MVRGRHLLLLFMFQYFVSRQYYEKVSYLFISVKHSSILQKWWNWLLPVKFIWFCHYIKNPGGKNRHVTSIFDCWNTKLQGYWGNCLFLIGTQSIKFNRMFLATICYTIEKHYIKCRVVLEIPKLGWLYPNCNTIASLQENDNWNSWFNNDWTIYIWFVYITEPVIHFHKLAIEGFKMKPHFLLLQSQYHHLICAYIQMLNKGNWLISLDHSSFAHCCLHLVAASS